ncbi:MAG: hypothetical protein HEQ39_09710 [Rhizobacter sp.]
MSTRGYIGYGDIHLNPWSPLTGLQLGWVYGGDAKKFAIKPNSEKKELESRGRDTGGQVIGSVVRNKPAELNITFQEVNKANLTLAFMGELISFNQSAQTVSAQAYVIGKTGGLGVPHRNINPATVVLTNDGATTTYVANTDYTFNTRLGMLFVVPGSALDIAVQAAVSPGFAVRLSYAALAQTGSRIRGAVRASIRTQIRFDGKNDLDGSPMDAEVYEAVLTPDSEFDFLADDWGELELSGTMNTPLGKAEPFIVNLPGQ